MIKDADLVDLQILPRIPSAQRHDCRELEMLAVKDWCVSNLFVTVSRDWCTVL